MGGEGGGRGGSEEELYPVAMKSGFLLLKNK
jgi:hypothetical protein